MKINIELSQSLSVSVNARFGMCHLNAQIGQLLNYPKALYIEGFAVVKGVIMPDPHSWLELNGEIIDPTYCNRTLPLPADDQIRSGMDHHDPVIASAYFPVLKLDLRLTQKISKRVAKRVNRAWLLWAIFDRDIFTDEQRQMYKQAENEAESYIGNMINSGQWF